MKGCYLCGTQLYIKTITYSRSILAPTTRVEELRQQLHNLTGEVYVPIESKYCPLCGKELKELQNG